jgi:hypothetical protein
MVVRVVLGVVKFWVCLKLKLVGCFGFSVDGRMGVNSIAKFLGDFL